MDDVDSLAQKLKETFHWNQARIVLLSQFILALIKVRTVNLSQLAEVFSGSAKISSNYKRLQRFLRHFDWELDWGATVIAQLFCPNDPWILSLDRTNWQFGKLDINFLVLGVVHRNICIPLLWVLLPKKGNSNTQERIALIERFLQIFSINKILYLTADREFKGGEWLKYLYDHQIHFCLRIAKDTLVLNKHQNRKLPVRRFFSLKVGESLFLNGVRNVWGVPVYLSCIRGQNELVILVSNHAPKESIARYKTRWCIETLFGCLKTRGFRLEDTHLQHLERLNKLFFVLAIAFAWCHAVGIWVQEQKAISIKKHGYPAQSLLHSGLAQFRRILINKNQSDLNFSFLLNFLSCS
jgi:hypothetical protein